jgi:biofilm PGA synthesis lipoprotein PgaB
MVWPYGAMDSVGVEEAARAGMPINFTLLDGLASTADIQAVERSLVGEELLLNQFTYMVKYGIPRVSQDPVRAITLNLDRIYDADTSKQEERLGRLIEQMVRLEVNTVVIQPFAADARQTYFPNVVLPMRADLLNRVAWQLRSRTNVNVYLHIPHNAIEQKKADKWALLDYTNLADKEQLLTLYSDLSQHATAQGLLFDKSKNQNAERALFNQAVVQRMRYFKPDLMLVDSEDNSPSIISIAVKNSNADAFATALEKMRFFKRMGVGDFLLDSDDFLNDPKRFEQIRKVYSLKENPFL